jgi:ribonuclease BN (tRNA processing enzyme)
MEVQLTVIGCSPAWPNPGSAQSGYLVESEGAGGLLLDCGPGVLARLREKRLPDVDAIAITHFHLDHWGDLVPWTWLALHGGSLIARPALWIPTGGHDDLSTFAERWGRPGMFTDAFEVAEYESGVQFTAAGFQIEPIPVEHYGLHAFGFRVRAPSGRLMAYSGDSGPCDGLHRLAACADLFLCEATLARDGPDGTPRGHLSAEEALSYSRGPTVLTHRPAELDTPPGVERTLDGAVLEV